MSFRSADPILRRAGVSLLTSLVLHSSFLLLDRRHASQTQAGSSTEIVQVALAEEPAAPVPAPAPLQAPEPITPEPVAPEHVHPPPPATPPPAAEEDAKDDPLETPRPAARPARRPVPSRVLTDAMRRLQESDSQSPPPAPDPAPTPVDEARAEELRQARGAYLDGLWSRLRSAFLVPATVPSSDAKTLSCRLSLRIQRDGHISARIAQPSGNPTFDAAVLDAIAWVNARPVPPPSEILSQLDRELTGPFQLGES